MHLETTNPDNLAFYRSLGFAVTGHLRFDFGGPELWGLWRAAG